MENVKETSAPDKTEVTKSLDYNQEQYERLKSQGVEAWNKWVVIEEPGINLTKADFTDVNLPGVKLLNANLNGAFFVKANLEGAILSGANLNGANLNGAILSGAVLNRVNLGKTDLNKTDFKGAELYKADLSGAMINKGDFTGAILTEADLSNADLEGAILINADLTGAKFSRVHFKNTSICDTETKTGPFLKDILWGESHLSELEDKFLIMRYTGEEATARNYKVGWQAQSRKSGINDRNLDTISKIEGLYKTATLVNRQLRAALAQQGLEQSAGEFAYRARITERKSLFWSWQKQKLLSWQWFVSLGKFLLSWFLYLSCGYGFRFLNALLTYVGVIFTFGILYWVGTNGLNDPKSNFFDAIVESVNIFHGRGIATDTANLLKDILWLKMMGALEATVGLIIEVTFIAALTQRLFSK